MKLWVTSSLDHVCHNYLAVVSSIIYSVFLDETLCDMLHKIILLIGHTHTRNAGFIFLLWWVDAITK